VKTLERAIREKIQVHNEDPRIQSAAIIKKKSVHLSLLASHSLQADPAEDKTITRLHLRRPASLRVPPGKLAAMEAQKNLDTRTVECIIFHARRAQPQNMEIKKT
jgi:hypothetical protein